MAFPFGFDLVGWGWCVVYLIGFLVALHQAEDHDYAKKFAQLTTGFTVVSWIIYEALRLHYRPQMHDECLLLLPRALVFWVAFCTLIRTFLHPDEAFSPRVAVAFYAVLSLFVGLGVYFSVIA